eukprot:TRINITY_DN3830_c0_g1_i9.p1 TRINITY_DN3830_c0_g1~~TRINITY_DN3830_c0_g1_i9.p1  ORF type:complete len:120 (+),score=15.21 TRINITY_DN3830_c0_g1_i9:75-434(+)
MVMIKPHEYGIFEEPPEGYLYGILTDLASVLSHIAQETFFNVNKEKLLASVFNPKFLNEKRAEFADFFENITDKTNKMGGYVYVEKLDVPMQINFRSCDWLVRHLETHPWNHHPRSMSI